MPPMPSASSSASARPCARWKAMVCVRRFATWPTAAPRSAGPTVGTTSCVPAWRSTDTSFLSCTATAGPSPNTIPSDSIPAMSWKTRVLSLRNVPAGQALGYNGVYVTPVAGAHRRHRRRLRRRPLSQAFARRLRAAARPARSHARPHLHGPYHRRRHATFPASRSATRSCSSAAAATSALPPSIMPAGPAPSPTRSFAICRSASCATTWSSPPLRATMRFRARKIQRSHGFTRIRRRRHGYWIGFAPALS